MKIVELTDKQLQEWPMNKPFPKRWINKDPISVGADIPEAYKIPMTHDLNSGLSNLEVSQQQEIEKLKKQIASLENTLS